MLTAGLDDYPGTVDDDTIEGTTTVSPAGTTLNSGDKIDGGEGTDTLKVAMAADFAGFSAGGSLTNVENVDLTVDGPAARTFNTTGTEGVEAYNLTGNVNLAALASAAAAVNLGARTADATLAFSANALLGSSDTLNLGVTDLGTSSSARTVTVAGTAANNALENVAVTATGANNVALAGTTTGVKTITAEGAGSLSLDISGVGATGLTSVDASALTGALNLTVANTILANNATVKGGSSATDTLTLKEAAQDGGYVMTGVEVLAFSGAGASDYNAVNTSGLNTVALASSAGGDKTVTNLGTASMLAELRGNTAAGSVSLDHTGTTGISVLGSSTGTVAAATAVVADVTVNSSSALELTVAENAKYNGTVSATSATSASITVNNTGSANANEITLTTGADKLVLLDVVSKGNLALEGAELGSVKELNVTTDGVFELSKTGNVDIAAANKVVISGEGTANLSNIGAAGTAGDLTVTVSGLTAATDKVALAAGTFASKDNTTVTVSDITAVTGKAVDLGAISSADKATTVSISNATVTSGTAVDLEAVTSKTGTTVTIADATATTGTAVNLTTVESDAATSLTITGASAGATGTAVATGAISGSSATVSVGASGKVTLGNTTATATNAAASSTVVATAGDVTVGFVSALEGTGAATSKVTATSTNAAHKVTVGAVVAGTGAATIDLSGTKLVANTTTSNGDITIGSGNIGPGLDAKGVEGKTATLILTDVTATNVAGTGEDGTILMSGTDAVTVSAGSLVLSSGQKLDVTAAKTDALTFTGSTTAENKLTAEVSETATITGGAEDDVFTITSSAAVSTTATININGGAGSDAITINSEDAAGKTRVVIENFAVASDSLVLDGVTKSLDTPDAAGLVTATGIISDFLTSAGVTATTAITNIFKLSAEADYIFQVNGATHIIDNNGAVEGNSVYDAGDTFITLVGVTGLATEAAVDQFLGGAL